MKKARFRYDVKCPTCNAVTNWALENDKSTPQFVQCPECSDHFAVVSSVDIEVYALEFTVVDPVE